MKRSILMATVFMGLAGVCNTASAENSHLARYVVSLNNGFAVMGIVAHTSTEFAQAQREANLWEGRRHVSLGPHSIAAVAVEVHGTDPVAAIRALTVDESAAGADADRPDLTN